MLPAPVPDPIICTPRTREDTERYDHMRAGYEACRIAQGNQPRTVGMELTYVDQFLVSSGRRYPWEWDGLDVDYWGKYLSLTGSRTTTRAKQGALKRFLAYLIDPARPWRELCQTTYGVRLRQLCTPENTTKHCWVYEGDPNRRPLSDEELGALFAALTKRMDTFGRGSAKNWRVAARDYAFVVVALCWGLRARELARLDLFDFRESPDPELKAAYGRYGCVHVRFGKAKRRGPPRRRWVLTVPLFEWGVEVLRWYIECVRPEFEPKAGHEDALFLTERGRRISDNYASGRFGWLRDAIGCLPDGASLHWLRHTYITNLRTENYDPLFVQEQVGHEDHRSIDIYTDVNNDYRQRVVRNFYNATRPAA